MKFQDKNIYDVLEMTVNQAIEFFTEHGQKKIVKKLIPLQDVGLGYIKLGQSSSTLSGGENQRVKLAFYLSQEKADPTLFIFDEPTNGLDVITERIVVNFLKELREQGKCIIISSHIFSLIEKICDRVVIIIRGKSVCCDTLENVMAGQSLEDRCFELYENMEGKADE